MHMRQWTYVAVNTICAKIASIMPNMAYVVDRPTSKSTKACERGYREEYTGEWTGASQFGGSWMISDGGHSYLTMGAYRSKALSVVKPHEELEPIESFHPLRRLFENPNTQDTSFDLLYELQMFDELCGLDYLWTVPNDFGGIAELWVIPSHWVWPRTGAGKYVNPEVPHADELIQYYEVRPWGGMGSAGSLYIPPDQIVMTRWKSPLNKIDGYSKLAAVAQWIDSEESISKSRWSQFQNQARPEFWVELGPGYEDPDDSRIQRVEAKIAAKIQGEYSYGKPLITPPGAKVTPLSFNPTEMAYFQSEEQIRDMILSAFGVPKSAVGVSTDMTYGSLLASLAQFCSACLNPRLSMRGQVLTKRLGARWDKKSPAWSQSGANGNISGGTGSQYRVRIWWDDCVPADPQQVNSDLAEDRAQNAVTPNEVRALRGRKPYKYGGDDPIMSPGAFPFPINTGDKNKLKELAEHIAPMLNAQTKGKDPQEVQKEEMQAQAQQQQQPGEMPQGGGTGGAQPSAAPPQEPNGKPTLDRTKSQKSIPVDRHGRGLSHGDTVRHPRMGHGKVVPTNYDPGYNRVGVKFDEHHYSSPGGHHPVDSTDLERVEPQEGVQTHGGGRVEWEKTSRRWGRAPALNWRGYPEGHRMHGHAWAEGATEDEFYRVYPHEGGYKVDYGRGHEQGNTVEDLGKHPFQQHARNAAQEHYHARIDPRQKAHLPWTEINSTRSILMWKGHTVEIWEEVGYWYVRIDGSLVGGAHRSRKEAEDDAEMRVMRMPSKAFQRGDRVQILYSRHNNENTDPAGSGEYSNAARYHGTTGTYHGPSNYPDAHWVHSDVAGERILVHHGDIKLTGSGGMHKSVSKKVGPHAYSSTQFNIDECNYPRSQGSPLLKLRQMQSQIEEEDLAGDGVEDELHVTVKYGLHTSDPDEVRRLIEGAWREGSVQMTLGRVSVFEASESGEFDVVKVEVHSDDLRRLNALISEHLETTDTHPVYQPHVTLAYVKPGTGHLYEGWDDVDGMEVHASELVFGSKDGHTTRIPLTRYAVKRLHPLAEGPDPVPPHELNVPHPHPLGAGHTDEEGHTSEVAGRPCGPGQSHNRTGCVPALKARKAADPDPKRRPDPGPEKTDQQLKPTKPASPSRQPAQESLQPANQDHETDSPGPLTQPATRAQNPTPAPTGGLQSLLPLEKPLPSTPAPTDSPAATASAQGRRGQAPERKIEGGPVEEQSTQPRTAPSTSSSQEARPGPEGQERRRGTPTNALPKEGDTVNKPKVKLPREHYQVLTPIVERGSQEPKSEEEAQGQIKDLEGHVQQLQKRLLQVSSPDANGEINLSTVQAYEDTLNAIRKRVGVLKAKHLPNQIGDPTQEGYTGLDTLGRRWRDGKVTDEVDNRPNAYHEKAQRIVSQHEQYWRSRGISPSDPELVAEMSRATKGEGRDLWLFRKHGPATDQNKLQQLVDAGLVKVTPGGFRVTSRGERELEYYDAKTALEVGDFKQRLRDHKGAAQLVQKVHDVDTSEMEKATMAWQDGSRELESLISRAAYLESRGADSGAIRKRYDKLRPQVEAHYKAVEEHRKRTRDAVAEALGLPPDKTTKLQLGDVAPEAEKDRGTVEESMEWLSRLVAKMPDGSEIAPVKLVRLTKTKGEGGNPDRPSYDPTGHFINTGKGLTSRAAAHELGHALELLTPGLLDACRAFLEYRCYGEQPRDMGELNPLLKGEMGRKDRFDIIVLPEFGESAAYYMGKSYGRYATEVFARLVEMAYLDFPGLARRDPEAARFLVLAMRGEIGKLFSKYRTHRRQT